MSLSLSRKTEKAFAVEFLPDALDIAGLNIYEGHADAGVNEFPSLIVYSEGSTQHPSIPVEMGARIVKLRCKLQVDSRINTRGDIDTWKELIVSKMTDDLTGIQDILNKPVGTDNRLIKGIHFHYVEMSDDPSDFVETDWIEDMIFNVTCEPLDS